GQPSCRGSWLLQQEREERFLGVEAVLRFVPHHGSRSLDRLGGDLLAPVGGQAVQHDRLGGAGEQRVVDLEGDEGFLSFGCLTFLPHRDPVVGGDRIRTGDGLARGGQDGGGAGCRFGTVLRAGEDL